MTDRIEYWIHEFKTPVGKVELDKKEQEELYNILIKLYEDNKMIYGEEETYTRK